MKQSEIDALIKKYEGILATLKENRSLTQGDGYDYDTDIKNCAEFIRDLKKLKK